MSDPADEEVSSAKDSTEVEPTLRRRDFSKQAAAASVGAVAVSAAGIGVGFLWPQPEPEPTAVYTCLVREVPVGKAKEIHSPKGERIYLLRSGDSADPGDILAIGSTCSHLGCKVAYKPDNEEDKRFHCPCHQGFFDQQGVPTAGPPERPLSRYETEVRGDLLFIKYRNV